MDWVTFTWSMIASVSLTLAAIYLLLWLRRRSSWPDLLFSLTAASTAAFTLCELWMMQAETPAAYSTALRWSHVPLFVSVVSITWFVRLRLNAGRLWLAWMICGLRAVALLLNFVMTPNINHLQVTGLSHIRFLGGVVAVAEGLPNPWMLIGQAGVLLLIAYVVDASTTAWKAGHRRSAMLVGGGIGFFLFAAFGTALLVLWGVAEMPFAFGLYFLGMIATMAYELSNDVLRAEQLTRDLQVSEAELREITERTNLAFEAGDLGVWVWDLKNDQVWLNDSMRNLYGIASAEPVAMDRLLQQVHPEDHESLRLSRAAAIAGTNGNRYRTDYRLLLPGGHIHWLESNGLVEVDSSGKAVRMRGISRDVTTIRQAESEATTLREELALAGRVSMMGQLASGLAHEINQPLASIQRNAEAAELYLAQPNPDLDEIRAILVDIRKDDERAGQVISRMRALLTRHALDSHPVVVGTLIGDVATLLRADAASRHVALDVTAPTDLPVALGDRIHLQQVLLNLVLNSMDALAATPAERRRVTITARSDGKQHIELAVSDSGPGIPESLLPKIFEPFFTTKPDGMGMGLAISRTIVEAHGGRLWASNNSAGGAIFHLSLPVRALDAVA